MSGARERWSEVQARQTLEHCERAGMTVHAYAREHGLSAQRLYYWRKRLDRQAGAEASLSLVPAHVLGASVAGAVVLRLPNDVAIEVADGSPSWVAALVRELLGQS